MRTLYQFPLSHFCEKARWMLDHKELDFVAQNLTPGVHRAFAQLKTGQNKLPILKDADRWIAGSTDIAMYLDEYYPEHPLLRHDSKLTEKILEIDQLTIELGRNVRRWGLVHMLNDGQSLDILVGEKGYLKQFEKYSKPLLKMLMTKGYQLNAENIAQAKQHIDHTVRILNEYLIDNQSGYMVGDRLSLADIAVCSMLAPLLQISSTPWEVETDHPVSDEFLAYQSELLALPLGQYIQRIYKSERCARVDWRGV